VSSRPLLSVRQLTAGYGPVSVLHGVSFEVDEGSVVALLGANGAGKTTTLSAISGLVPVVGGDVTFGADGIIGRAPRDIVARGLAHVPEGRKIFPELTVEENLRFGAYLIRDRRKVAALLDDVMESFPRLRERRKQMGGTLSGGEQQMLAFGRALMGAPRMLLLDEPSLGLAPLVVAEIERHIRGFRAQGLTVLLVEQNAKMALALSDYAYVLELGTIVAEGAGEEMLQNPALQEAYLGTATPGPDERIPRVDY
jgi:branched-chain amino acid transport system ATP-binding protein